MNVRRLITLGVPLIVGLAIALLWPDAKRSPEDEVRAVFAGLTTAAEKRDVAAVAETLSESFRSGAGGRQETKQLIAAVLLRSPQGVTVLNPSLNVTISSPTTASFKGTFLFAQGSGGAVAQPTDGLGSYEITGTLEKRGGEWQFVTAEWHR